jgi:lambda family phage minor tail protein L
MSITLALAQQLQNLEQTYGYAEFYTLDLTQIGGSLYRFTPNASSSGGNVTWQANAYTSMPISTAGWDIAGTGAMPRPTLSISNVSHVLLTAVATLGDIVGGTLTRVRTFEQFIDGGSAADPNAFLPPDVFVIEQLIEHTNVSMTWQLTSVLDRFGMQLPRRQVLKDKGFPGVARIRT